MNKVVSFYSKKNHPLILHQLNDHDLDRLTTYLHHLSDETKKRFSPHPYDKSSIIKFYSWPNDNAGFVAMDPKQTEIIAYAIIKYGYLQDDKQRLESYGLEPDKMKCGTYAPSVADAWQGLGIGKAMLGYILNWLKAAGIEYIILWGGVQTNNENAINFYTKAGFKTLGSFEHFGTNYDMMLTIEA